LATYIPSWLCKVLTPEWLTAIGTVGSVVVALILAVWSEEIKAAFVRPRLSLKTRVGRPDAEKTVWHGLSAASAANPPAVYFFRLAISNKGRAAAHDVQVFLASIEHVTSGRIDEVTQFTPMNLKWSYRGGATLPTLLPHMPPVYCDLAHVTEPTKKASFNESLPGLSPDEAVLALDVEFPPNTLGHLLRAGTYHFHLIIAAANDRPHRYTREVVFCGKWFEEEEKMFDVGFKIRGV
jgi:hypothetical protein